MFVSAFRRSDHATLAKVRKNAREYCFTINPIVTGMRENADLLFKIHLDRRENNKINQLLNVRSNKNTKLNKLQLLAVVISRR